MTTATPGPRRPALLKPWPVIVVITVGWLVATVLAFTVPGLHDCRPFAVAGSGVGVLGTSIFLWQRRPCGADPAARRADSTEFADMPRR